MSTHILAKRRPYIFKQFNWRALLVRILVNALTLIITVLLTPSMGFVMPLAIWKIVLLAVVLGLLNALIKPIIQFLTLSYIFATYGFVVVFINTIILYLLSWFLPGYFHVSNFLWAFLGGAIMGIMAGFLESLFGLTLPIVDEASISEPMRKATAYNERKKQAFPFNEISDYVLDKPAPALPQSDSAVIDAPSPAPAEEPVPVELTSPPVAGQNTLEAPATAVIESDVVKGAAIEESAPAVETISPEAASDVGDAEESVEFTKPSPGTLQSSDDQAVGDAPAGGAALAESEQEPPSVENSQDDSETGDAA